MVAKKIEELKAGALIASDLTVKAQLVFYTIWQHMVQNSLASGTDVEDVKQEAAL
jgi:hypothetical protein